MRLTNAVANREIDPERPQRVQEEERERAKTNATSVKNSTVSENCPEVKIQSYLMQDEPGEGVPSVRFR